VLENLVRVVEVVEKLVPHALLSVIENLDLDYLVHFLLFKDFTDDSRQLVLFKIVSCAWGSVYLGRQRVIMWESYLTVDLHSYL
jgi:hypothetical protein